MTLAHHDLCFGCGLANVFGLHLEMEDAGEGAVTGRFFVKQDHQGPPGVAHGGVIAAALDEAMALALHAAGMRAVTRRLDVSLFAPVPVGEFVRVTARMEDAGDATLRASAAATSDSEPERALAEAHGEFAVVDTGPHAT